MGGDRHALPSLRGCGWSPDSKPGDANRVANVSREHPRPCHSLPPKCRPKVKDSKGLLLYRGSLFVTRFKGCPKHIFQLVDRSVVCRRVPYFTLQVRASVDSGQRPGCLICVCVCMCVCVCVCGGWWVV